MSLNNLYIHYHYQNYLRFGIEPSQGNAYSGSKVYDFNAQKQRLINKIKNHKGSLSEATIERYQELFDQILTSTSSKNDSKIIEAQRLLQQLLDNKYKKGINNIYYTDGGMAALSGNELLHRQINKTLKIKRDTLEALRLKDTNQKHKISKLESSLKNVYSIANEFIAAASREGLDASKIKSTVAQLDRTIKNIASDQNTNFSNIGEEDGTKISTILRNYFNSSYVSHDNSLVKQVNGLIELMRSPSITGLACDIGEYTAEVAKLIYLKEIGLFQDEVDKQIKSIEDGHILKTVGAETEKFSRDASLYNLAAMFNIKASDLSVNITEDAEGNGNSYNKIDVMLYDQSGREVGVSVKNYNLSNNYYIKLVDNTPLTKILLEDPEFAAHYLNITSVHEQDLVPEKGKTVKSYKGGKTYSQYKQQANDALKLSALVPALGGFQGRGKAEYILMNDSSRTGSNSVKIIPIDAIVAEVAKRDVSHTVSAKVTNAMVQHKNINALTSKSLWPNKWEEAGPQARIAKLLSEVHKAKIEISISPDVFRTMMGQSSRFKK